MKEKKVKDKAEVRVSSIGGQALMEGVMMRGVNSMAMAVRAPEGEILLESKRFKGKRKWHRKVPVVRGVSAFVDSLVSGVQTLVKSAEVSSPEEETPSKGWMGFAVFLGIALGVGLFILLPSLICSLFFDYLLKLEGYVLLKSLTEGILRICIFVLYLMLVSKMKEIKRTFMYHGAEHRTINCYEKGLEMTVENVQKCSTRHNRCGTTFLFFVMIISILLFSFANWVFEQIGITAQNYGQTANIFIKFGIRLALLPIVAGLSYELLKFLAFLPDNGFTAVLRAPGLALQRLTTYPPTDDMAEVALKSFSIVLEMDANPAHDGENFGAFSVEYMRSYIKNELNLTDAGAPESDWILCDVFKVKRSELANCGKTDLKAYNRIKEIIKRRKNGEPLAYVLGYTDFYYNRIKVNKNVLIPRPETELLCEKALQYMDNKQMDVLDLCTGSGCIAKALTKNENAHITASDISQNALDVAEENLKEKAKLILSDIFSGFSTEDKFDLIVSNPPYIETATLEALEKGVKDFEPRIALDGGEDGLKFYRLIAEGAPKHLKENGMLMLEIGYNQAQSVAGILSEAFTDIQIFKDYSGNDRIITAKMK